MLLNALFWCRFGEKPTQNRIADSFIWIMSIEINWSDLGFVRMLHWKWNEMNGMVEHPIGSMKAGNVPENSIENRFQLKMHSEWESNQVDVRDMKWSFPEVIRMEDFDAKVRDGRNIIWWWRLIWVIHAEYIFTMGHVAQGTSDRKYVNEGES